MFWFLNSDSPHLTDSLLPTEALFSKWTSSNLNIRRGIRFLQNLLKAFDFGVKIEIEGKTRQNVENKQTFDFRVKIEIEPEGKTRQNAENKQTFDSMGEN